VAHRFKTEIWVPRGLEEVFSFFSDAHNLETLTPPWLRFQVLTPGLIEMKAGVHIDYRLRLRGIPIGWQSEISVWEPPHRFVDEQRRGPYRLWVHEHTFFARDGGTLVRDEVEYDLVFGALVNRLFVRPDLEKIFSYRHQVLKSIFQKEG
jgi:ligand-binding SRPBCC domain-containing protein